MTKEMIINAVVPEDIRVAILNEGKLEEFFEEYAQEHATRGNIYQGRIVNIAPSLDACFVDYGVNRHGFLPFTDIVPEVHGRKANDETRIDRLLRRGQMITCQVEKEAAGTKGARLTTDISLAGRYMVLMPFSDTRGVSKKIEDPVVRKQCREVASEFDIPSGSGLIIRTAGMDQNKRSLGRDLNFLKRVWKDIEEKARSATEPTLLYAEADLIQRVLRDYYDDEVEKIWIDDRMALEKAERFCTLYMPRQHHQLLPFAGRVPIFSHFGVETQLAEIHDRRVALPSGGSLVIDQTEALVAIDVNSGKMKGQRTQEDTAYETNLEAVREVARQLTLRDLGGIIVIDLIDMTSAVHKSAVERALKEALKSSKARHRISKISSFGLCTLTRQRLGRSIRLTGRHTCPACAGAGVVPAPEAVVLDLLRQIRAHAAGDNVEHIGVSLAHDIADRLQNRHRAELFAIEQELGVEIEILAKMGGALVLPEFEVRLRPEAEPAEPKGAEPVRSGAASLLREGPPKSIEAPHPEPTPPVTSTAYRSPRVEPTPAAPASAEPAPADRPRPPEPTPNGDEASSRSRWRRRRKRRQDARPGTGSNTPQRPPRPQAPEPATSEAPLAQAPVAEAPAAEASVHPVSSPEAAPSDPGKKRRRRRRRRWRGPAQPQA